MNETRVNWQSRHADTVLGTFQSKKGICLGEKTELRVGITRKSKVPGRESQEG